MFQKMSSIFIYQRGPLNKEKIKKKISLEKNLKHFSFTNKFLNKALFWKNHQL